MGWIGQHCQHVETQERGSFIRGTLKTFMNT